MIDLLAASKDSTVFRAGLATALVGLALTAICVNAQAATTLGQLPAADPGTGSTSLAYGVPVPSSGVITSWQVRGDANSGDADSAASLTLWREVAPVEGPSRRATLFGRVTSRAVRPGVNTFTARLPVDAGDYLGLSTYYLSPFVAGDGIACVQISSDSVNVGDTTAFSCGGPDSGPGVMNLAAVLEPDADKDGFGDDSQDRCPGTAGDISGCLRAAKQLPAMSRTAAVGMVKIAIRERYPGARIRVGACKRLGASAWSCSVTWSTKGRRYRGKERVEYTNARKDWRDTLTGVRRASAARFSGRSGPLTRAEMEDESAQQGIALLGSAGDRYRWVVRGCRRTSRYQGRCTIVYRALDELSAPQCRRTVYISKSRRSGRLDSGTGGARCDV